MLKTDSLKMGTTARRRSTIRSKRLVSASFRYARTEARPEPEGSSAGTTCFDTDGAARAFAFSARNIA